MIFDPTNGNFRLEALIQAQREAMITRPTTYTVTLQTPLGERQVEVPTRLGVQDAERRAPLAFVALYRGVDLSEVQVISTSLGR